MGQCFPIHPLEVKLHVTVKQTALLLCVWAVMSLNLLPRTQYCTRFFMVFHSTWSDVRNLPQIKSLLLPFASCSVC